MAGLRDLGRIEAAVAELEAEAAPAKPYTPLPWETLLFRLESVFEPKALVEINADEAERRFLWPAWELMRVLSHISSDMYRAEELDEPAAGVLAALDAIGAAIREDDATVDAWNFPVNECTLAIFKRHLGKGGIPWRVFRLTEAVDIEPLLRQLPGPYLPPWHKSFIADRAKWPSQVAKAVEAALAVGDCLTPSQVDPFRWTDVQYSTYGDHVWAWARQESGEGCESPEAKLTPA